MWPLCRPRPEAKHSLHAGILSIAIAVTLTTSLVLVLVWRNLRVTGEMPSSLFAFMAILFTSGLDVGLIMFPLTEFPVYAAEAPYRFASPLASSSVSGAFWCGCSTF